MSVPKASSTQDPVGSAAWIVSAASAVIALLVSFGLQVTAEQTAAILAVVFIAAQAAQAIWTRHRVTPNTKVLELTDGADVIAGPANDLLHNGERVRSLGGDD